MEAVARRRGAGSLALCALLHLLVDAACGMLLWSAVRRGLASEAAVWSAFIAYNMLAFALQPVFGLLVDRWRAPAQAAALGAAACAGALLLGGEASLFVPAVVLTGLGNALFHVGGGVVSLKATPGRATAPGLFVAPGAAGVLIGIFMGKSGTVAWPLVVLIAVASVLLLITPARSSTGHTRPAQRRASESPWATSAAISVLILLLAVIGVRSYVGLALSFPWKSDTALLVSFTAAVVAGKAAGGMLADRFGWRLIAVGALLASAPLLALGAASAAAGIAGILVFNMTMPVTLVAAARLLPSQEGFAFGLTCLALFCGAAPVLLGWTAPLSAPALVAAVCLSAIALWLGLTPPGDLALHTRGARKTTVADRKGIA